MMLTNSALLSRFIHTPSLVEDSARIRFESCIAETSGLISKLEADASKPRMSGDDDFWFAEDDWRAFLRPYTVKDGVLQIPVKGVLLHDFPYQYFSYATGYEYIWQAFKRGLGDGNVKGIALIIDSPGGEVAGNFDLVDRMFAARGKKRIEAFAAESAYSAAYSIASVAQKITVTRSGGVGSIGVITMHVDISQMIDKAGIKITFIHFGKHKKDGNTFEELPKDVKERIQARIDELGEEFVAIVARNRAMDAKAVRDTEAATFTASEAVSNGLADAIGSLEDAVAAYAAQLVIEEKDETMTTTTPAVDQAAIETARTEALAQGRTEGANAMRTRINAIVSSDEGKKRPTMAQKMAIGDKFAALDSETIIGMLADLPEEKAETAPVEPKDDKTAKKDKASTDFATTMNKSKNPDLATGAEDDTDRDPKASVIDDTFALVGRKRKAA